MSGVWAPSFEKLLTCFCHTAPGPTRESHAGINLGVGRSGSGLEISRFRVSGSGFRALSLGYRVCWGLEFMGFRDWILGYTDLSFRGFEVLDGFSNADDLPKGRTLCRQNSWLVTALGYRELVRADQQPCSQGLWCAFYGRDSCRKWIGSRSAYSQHIQTKHSMEREASFKFAQSQWAQVEEGLKKDRRQSDTRQRDLRKPAEPAGSPGEVGREAGLQLMRDLWNDLAERALAKK